VKATKDGSPRPGVPLPRLFCIGPLVDEERGRELECLTWLDSQPAESVVFLCFGSASSVPAEGDRRGAGEERARVPLGRARARGPPRRLDEAVRRARRGGALLHARPVVSTWAAQVQALRDRRVRDALRVELQAGGARGGGAARVLADVRGAEAEQGAPRGGREARCGDAGATTW
jgi:hypothetical protein